MIEIKVRGQQGPTIPCHGTDRRLANECTVGAFLTIHFDFAALWDMVECKDPIGFEKVTSVEASRCRGINFVTNGRIDETTTKREIDGNIQAVRFRVRAVGVDTKSEEGDLFVKKSRLVTANAIVTSSKVVVNGRGHVRTNHLGVIPILQGIGLRKETFDVLLLKDRMSRMNLLLESNNPGGGENCVCVCLFRESAALLANFLVLSVSVEEWEIFRIQRI